MKRRVLSCLMLAFPSLALLREPPATSPVPAAAACAQDTFVAAQAADLPEGKPETGPPRDLHGLATGKGFAGPWDVQNGSTRGYRVECSHPLTFNELATSSHYVVGGDAYQSAGRLLDVDKSFPDQTRTVDDGNGGQVTLLGKSGSTLYLSMLLRKDADNAQPVFLGVHGSNIPWLAGERSAAVGYFGESSDAEGNRLWSLEIGKPSGANKARNVLPTEHPITPGRPSLFVVAFHFEELNTTVDLYVDPEPLGGEPPALPDVSSVIATADLRIRAVGLQLGDAPNQGALSSLRLGTTWASVTPAKPKDNGKP